MNFFSSEFRNSKTEQKLWVEDELRNFWVSLKIVSDIRGQRKIAKKKKINERRRSLPKSLLKILAGGDLYKYFKRLLFKLAICNCKVDVHLEKLILQ